jgi:hypothetical protein
MSWLWLALAFSAFSGILLLYDYVTRDKTIPGYTRNAAGQLVKQPSRIKGFVKLSAVGLVYVLFLDYIWPLITGF